MGRVLCEYSAKQRAAVKSDGQLVVAPKLYVIHFNCDDYIAAGDVKVGGLLLHTGTSTNDNKDYLKLKPTKLFAEAISRLVDELLELERLEKEDEDWFNSLKEITLVYFRYDGCDRVTGKEIV